MDKQLFEQLLYEEEGSALDFKSQQYQFSSASLDQKSELLKDILVFANAWRRETAYILVGVDEVRGGRSAVVGISDHLDDHSLQQFVNQKTNRPVAFSYDAFDFEAKQVGVISIEVQERPLYLTHDYGRLVKETVYLRRGSSTDVAAPDEIARMGQMGTAREAELAVELADAETDQAIGFAATLQTEFCNMPSAIPDLDPLPRRGWAPVNFSAESDANRDFYRETAEHIFMKRFTAPLRFVVENIGSNTAGRVRIEVTTESADQYLVIDKGDLPGRPYRDRFRSLTGGVRSIHSILNNAAPGATEIRKANGGFAVAIECGELQPGRKVWSRPILFGRNESGDIRLKVVVFASNLSKPSSIDLTVSLSVSRTEMSMDELKRQPCASEASD